MGTLNNRNSMKFSTSTLLVLLCITVTFGESWIRVNELGYTAVRPKTAIIMADTDLNGTSWLIEDESGTEVSSGSLSTSLAGEGKHTPKPFNYDIDFSSIEELGKYTITLQAGDVMDFTISEDPYSFLIPQVLRFIRVARSGTSETMVHGLSHTGDAEAILYHNDGPGENGLWAKVSPEQTIDMLGGWYDAGDYIKFTLTNAITAYYLLKAYDMRPDIHTKVNSTSELVDILDEIKFGLDYLLKTFPSNDEFIVQVSTGDDHNLGLRMPEDDTRDGSREALSAISQTQMGYTAAALAYGARIFESIGYTEDAEAYLEMAKAIFDRAIQSDAIPFTFEAYDGGAFYNDNSAEDNMALAAIELYESTQEQQYLDKAIEFSTEGAYWFSWANQDLIANMHIGKHNASNLQSAESELSYFFDQGQETGNIWHVPSQYVWASLPGWIGTGALTAVFAEQTGNTDYTELFYDMVDYTFGKNNWGVSFIASPDIGNSIQNIYNQIYILSGEFPLGALSEGPGDRSSHDELDQFFSIDANDPFNEFNTTEAVFYDNETDFMCQEAVVHGQPLAILLLAMASPQNPSTQTGSNSNSSQDETSSEDSLDDSSNDESSNETENLSSSENDDTSEESSENESSVNDETLSSSESIDDNTSPINKVTEVSFKMQGDQWIYMVHNRKVMIEKSGPLGITKYYSLTGAVTKH